MGAFRIDAARIFRGPHLTDRDLRPDAELVINGRHYLTGVDPFVLFEAMGVTDPSHAFYLGYELMKAKTALTLGKDYRQDQALDWGYLTEPEVSHRERKRRAPGAGEPS